MEKPPVSIKHIVISIILSSIVVIAIFLHTVTESGTRLVFCNVGQGDGAYIRIRNKIDIVIDAGPNKKILDCLGRYMPFYDKTIEFAILTHPQTDHYYGFIYILDRYKVDKFIFSPVNNSSETFKKLLLKINNKHIGLIDASKYTNMQIDKARLNFHWPTIKFTSQNLNDLSLVFTYEESGFRALFTGDASPVLLTNLLGQPNLTVDILEVPHHGSINGLTKNFLELAEPRLAVISVGKNNAYGHPAKRITDMLKALKVNYLRTDQKGDIVIRIKGSQFKVEK